MVVAAACALLGPAPASADIFGPTVTPTSNTDPGYQSFLAPIFSVPDDRYQALVGTDSAYTGAEQLALENVRVFLDPHSAPATRSAFVIVTDLGGGVFIVSVTPTGPLNTGFTQIPLSGVTLESGQGIAFALGTNATSGSFEVGGVTTPGATAYGVVDFSGTTGTVSKDLASPNHTVAVAVEGSPANPPTEPPTQPPPEPPLGERILCTFAMELFKRSPVGDITIKAHNSCPANATTREELDVDIDAQAFALIGKAAGGGSRGFTLKSQRLTLEPDEDKEIHLRWKHHARTVRQISELLEESAAARRAKLKIKIDVTHANGTTEKFTGTTKLKP